MVYPWTVRPARHPERFALGWSHAANLTRPGFDAIRLMLLDLRRDMGDRDAASAVGCPTRTFRGWVNRQKEPSACACRAVWAAWIFRYHPERVRTWFDWVTWGTLRPRDEPTAPPGPPAPPAAG